MKLTDMENNGTENEAEKRIMLYWQPRIITITATTLSLIVLILFLQISRLHAEEGPKLSNNIKAVKTMLVSAMKECRYTDGVALANEAVKRWPDSAVLGNWEAFFLLKLGKDNEAKLAYLRISSSAVSDRQRSYAFASVSYLEEKAGNIRKAMEYATKADQLEPLPTTKRAIANLEYHAGNYKEAIRHYNEAITLIPKMNFKDQERIKNLRASLNYQIALCYVRLENFQEAQVIMEHIQKDPPRFFYPFTYYAILGDPERASKELDNALRSQEQSRRRVILDYIEKDIDKNFDRIKDAPAWCKVIKGWRAEK